MIKWILYYIAVIAGNIVAANLLHGHLNVTAQSFFPVLYSIAPILFFYSAKNREFYYTKNPNIAPIYDETGTKRWVSFDGETSFERIFKGVTFALLPFCLTFVLFFPNRVKIFSFLLFLAPIAVCTLGGFVLIIIAMRGMKKESQSQKEKLEKELEEQRRREEMGKWK